MNGRLEHTMRTENNIESILKSLPEYVSDYYYSISVGLEPKSCEDYIRKIRRFLQSIDTDVMNIDINDITNRDITRYLHSVEKKTDSDGETEFTSFSYRKTVYTALSSFFNYLYRVGLVKQNPMADGTIARPKNSDEIKRIKLTAKDINNILDSVDEEMEEMNDDQKKWAYRDKAIISLFIHTGMRETALSEINLSDINFMQDTLTVTDKRNKKHEYIIGKKLKNTLVTWIGQRNIILGDEENDALFISSHKRRMSEKAISNVVKKYSEKGLGYEISPHKLRAAFCTILYEEKKDIEFVRQAVGHSNVATTQRYIVSNNSARGEAAEIMDDKFDN